MPIVLNGSGPITGVTSLNTTVSDTELGYLDGVTSALQTQINGKATETAWQNFTPTWTNATVGNGTVVARYQQIGKTVYGYVSLTLGSTSSIASGPLINVPVAGSSSIVDRLQVGQTTLFDSGTATFTSVTSFRTGTPQTLTFGATAVSGSNTSIGGPTSTIPFTWTTGDVLAMTFQYEAA